MTIADSPSPTAAQPHPLDHLTVLRGIFCVAVVEGHSYGMLPVPKREQIAALLNVHGFSCGFLLYGIAPAAVWGFFILSGYLIGKGFYRGRYAPTLKGIGLFYGNRLKRILPLYYFFTLIACIFIAPVVFDFGSSSHRDVIPIVFFFINMSGPVYFRYIGHIWSLSTEMQFYLLSPFLAFALYKFCRTAVTALPLLLCLVGVSILWRWHLFVLSRPSTANWVYYFYCPLWPNLEFFLAGFLATPLIQSLRAWLSHRGGLRHPRAIRLVGYVFFLGSIASWAYIIRGWENGSNWGYVAFMAFLPAIIILATVISIVLFEVCANSVAPRSKSLPEQLQLVRKHPARIFEVFGTLTYGIYLWHFPILMKLSPYLTEIDPVVHFVELFGTVLAVTVLLAGVTYHFIEYPFDAKKKFQ